MTRPGLACLALLFAASCGGGGGDARIRLSLDGQSCSGLTPGQIGLPCGGAIGLWALDAGDEILQSRCVAFDADRTRLSDVPSILSDAGVSLDVGGGEKVVFELAIYGPEATGCPRDGVGAAAPLQFARSEPLKLTGSEPEIELLLECLAQAEACGEDEGFITVDASVFDFDTLQPAGEQRVLDVGLHAVFSGASSENEQTRLEPLGELTGAGGAWTGMIAEVPPESACTATLVSTVDGFDFLSCEASFLDPDERELMTTAYVLDLEGMGSPDESTLEAVLENGVVYGRIMTAEGEPVPVEQVQALDPSYSVQVDGDRFVAFAEGSMTSDCCVQFTTGANDMGDGEAITEPVPVFPNVVTTVRLIVP